MLQIANADGGILRFCNEVGRLPVTCEAIFSKQWWENWKHPQNRHSECDVESPTAPAMIATLPTHKTRIPMGMTYVVVLAGLVVSPVLIKAHLDYRTRSALADEYRSARPAILSRIETAEANQDLESLLRIHGKYSGYVTDSKFKRVLADAVSKTSARVANLELAVSRNLDLTRNREELGERFNRLPQEQVRPGDEALSVLPR